MKKLLSLFALALSLSASAADTATPYIAVGQAKTKKTILAFPEIKVLQSGANTSNGAKVIYETVLNDLNFMDLFKFYSSSGFIENQTVAGLTPDRFKYSDWSAIKVEFLIKAGITQDGGKITLEGYVYDITGAKQILAKRYIAGPNDVKILGHTFADQIVEALTGMPGIFRTKLAMSCDRTGNKEIYIMNYDGTEVKQITSHRSVATAPAWSPDGNKIVYSLHNKNKNNVKNIDLFLFNFKNETISMLSNRKGINSGPAFSPDGKKIALTMSFLGNPEVFTLDPSDRTVTRLTHSLGFEVDPAWSPDGKKMAFVSSRTGRPMIFSMNADGSNVQRLTFAGVYNATPTWAPTNKKIGFAGWLDNQFDIFVMNPDGTNIERLTKDAGNNEDPHFSPDGNFIVFSSNRTGQQNVYVMNVDGTFVKRLTYGLGNCVAPKWSNPLKD